MLSQSRMRAVHAISPRRAIGRSSWAAPWPQRPCILNFSTSHQTLLNFSQFLKNWQLLNNPPNPTQAQPARPESTGSSVYFSTIHQTPAQVAAPPARPRAYPGGERFSGKEGPTDRTKGSGREAVEGRRGGERRAALRADDLDPSVRGPAPRRERRPGPRLLRL